MHAAIADKKEELAELCRRYDVARLEVFGSAARGTDFDPQSSDADFLVEFHLGKSQTSFDHYFDFADALRSILGRPVDLVEPSAIQNPYFRAEIDSSLKVVFVS